MTAAASVLARTVLDLMEQPHLIESAQNDMKRAKNGSEYRSLIPAEIKAGSF